MARILIAWELGAGLGHLTRILPVAEALGRRGHRLFLALQHLGAARAAGLPERLAGADLAVRQAPRWPVPRGPHVSKVPTHSLADVLKRFGFHEAAQVSAVARAWREILREAQPDLVIGDFSPGLRLALGERCPMVVLGNGYTVPPAGRPLPPIRPWEAVLPPASLEAEAEITRTLADEMAAAGDRAPGHLSDLFAGTRTFVCTVPDFDPYAAHRSEATVAPFNLPAIGPVVPVDQRPEGRVFVYLQGDHPDLPILLEALRNLGLSGIAYIPGLPPSLRERFAGPGLEFRDKPQPLGELLPTVRLLVHHGGLSTAYAGLASATPQLLLTWNLEHLVTARGVARYGCSIVTTQVQRKNVGTMEKALQALATDPRPRLAAEQAAKIVAGRAGPHPLAGILAACEELLAA